ncbi:three-helix bundle dimerization domain-containing protein [Microbacterium pumilum]|uniref:Uncharacterized protein n=1 Tax=Microbacterium pumilum TaxID=344165 RepID=A0ABP5EHC5_9MICO
MDTSHDDNEIASIIDRLEKQFPDVPPPDVEAVAFEAQEAFGGHPIRSYAPALVERQAKERLRGWSADRSGHPA